MRHLRDWCQVTRKAIIGGVFSGPGLRMSIEGGLMTISPVSAEKISQAMDRFDRELRANPQWVNWENGQTHRYAIKKGAMLYPVKQVIAMACGAPLASFGGSAGANDYVKERGFEIVSLRMTEHPGVFLLQSEDSLVAMEPASFAREDDFQRLLSRFPELLVGDQVNPQSPRRWLLVRREVPISTGETGASQWSIDHVFLDQEGIPTLVEIKRQSDSRIRREVVGQMLDYAANCLSYWSVETLKSGLMRTCEENGQPLEAALSELTGTDTSVEEFWQLVKTNLQAKRVRLLFVADVIPLELRRIVEFLNEQMDPAEVLAIELKQFESKGLKVLVPTVYGQTQETATKRSGVGRRWDEVSLFDKLKGRVGASELQVAREIYEWMRRDGKRDVIFGTGKENGSVYPAFKPNGVGINPLYLSTDGKLWLQFPALENKPVFGSIESRRELMQKFNTLDNVNFTEADLSKYRSIPLSTIARDTDGLDKIIRALTWMGRQIEQAT
jgi:hypothetical protein